MTLLCSSLSEQMLQRNCCIGHCWLYLYYLHPSVCFCPLNVLHRIYIHVTTLGSKVRAVQSLKSYCCLEHFKVFQIVIILGKINRNTVSICNYCTCSVFWET